MDTNILSIVLSIIGIAAGISISIYFARGQNKQLDELSEVLKGTRDITSLQNKQLDELSEISNGTRKILGQMNVDEQKDKLVSIFLGTNNDSRNSYTCVFPVSYDSKPLPNINSGDYHAIQVLQNALGHENLILRPLTSQDNTTFNSNIIYLCTPQANSALKFIAKDVEIDKNNKCNVNMQLDGTYLPCWFANIDWRNMDGQIKRVKCIWIKETGKALISESEDAYIKAEQLLRGEPFVPHINIQTDYSILLRLTKGNRRIIVIAGIHQYGTWTCGDFFQDLIEGRNISYKDIFLSNNDIIAIIYGNFNTENFTTMDSGIHNNSLWYRSNCEQEWQKVKN